jgi:aspartyl-tRNA(Asn)/glutamyl-tRNA(Gln) amidotransferase subunit B
MNKYKPVIGLEVHVELKTNSKMFCGCSADYFGQKPNTHTCPVCLGLPGALPVPNKKAVEWCVMIGMALNCEIPLFSKFDRKNYFYPDLPKGYQISQYDQPFAINGHIKLSDGKVIRVRRVHMEEDTGKLMHETLDGKKVSLVDFNRSSVPLVEIVTEPDFENAKQVKEYLQKLQQIVRFLGVATADMEKGEMRLEPNISLRAEGQTELPKYKVEVKNINSFGFVEKAIEFEIVRQAEILDSGELPKQETRGFVEIGSKTVSQRSKEEAEDYRYFPDPDLTPISWQKEQIDAIRTKMPELPDIKKERFVKSYQVSEYNADVLTKDWKVADYFEEALRAKQKLGGESITLPNANDIANWIINKKVDIEAVLPAQLVAMFIASNVVSGISDEELHKVLQTVIDANQKVVEDYKKGKENAIMFLVGQAMRELKGKAKADEVREKLLQLIQ